MRSRSWLFLVAPALAAIACGSSGTPVATGTGGQTTTGTGGVSAGTGGGGGASTGTGGISGGTGGVAAGTGGVSAGTGGTTDAGNDAPGGDIGSGTGCPADAIICETFEKYAAGATDLGPDWVAYKYGGATMQVDTTKPWKGAKALHITAPVGGRKYADIIKQLPLTQELLPIKHYGRVMVWVTALPSAAHWNINQAGGPLASNAQIIGKYSFGGQNSVLSPNYSQRPPVGDNLTPLRGGGPEDGDPNASVDCGPNAQNQKLSVGKWVCWEWMFDGQANKIQLFLDSVEQTQAGVTGRAGDGCGGWQGPKQFNKMIIGWEVYTQASDKAQDAWLDDLVVGPTRVGCPAM